jgi:hypothetical protein
MGYLHYLFIAYIVCSCCISRAQKKSIDSSTCDAWPHIENVQISADGKFFSYSINIGTSTRLFVGTENKSWKQEFHEATAIQFSADSKFFLFSVRDSIGIINLLQNNIYYIANTASFKIAENGAIIAYKLKGAERELILYNISTSISSRLSGTKEFFISKSGNYLVANRAKWSKNVDIIFTSICNLKSGNINNIYSISNVKRILFNKKEDCVVYTTDDLLPDKNAQHQMGIINLKTGERKILIKSELLFSGNWRITDQPFFFSEKEDKIFFYARNQNILNQSLITFGSGVDIWNYNDTILQAGQLAKAYNRKWRGYLSVIYLNDLKIIKLGQENDNFSLESTGKNNQENLLLINNAAGTLSDYKWFRESLSNVYMISTRDGSRRLLQKNVMIETPEFSGTGRFIIWYDKMKKNWFIYDVISNCLNNITASIRVPLYYNDDHPDLADEEGLAGWIENDGWVLIYDRNDIWMVDPTSLKQPINITHGYGRRNNIRFRHISFEEKNENIFHIGEEMLLSALNTSTKQNGFFKIKISAKAVLKKQVLDNHVYYFTYRYMSPGINGLIDPVRPIKAKKANKYIVRIMSTTEYPNLYYTTDFLHFTQLTDLKPQLLYNWITSELIHWQTYDNIKCEGILYKPENFDKSRKYPIIFYCYEKNADILNSYIEPDLSNGALNIPWFVSNGYLIFVPDIHYTSGHPGRSAFNSVVSAARYLAANFSWIDSAKMGLQGHSYGGFEINYIVSHTSIFAAAAPAAGLVNEINAYGKLLRGYSSQYMYESRQGRIGASLWKRPELYLENSALFNANKVTTPLLIMHNKQDFAVEWEQGVQWYLALRRFSKQVWMLQYNDEGHTLMNRKNMLDYSIKLTQFFDFYLKDNK